MRRIRTALVLAVGFVLATSAIAAAVDTPQTYTGCLSKDGTVLKVAIGTNPKQVCGKTETQISWNEVGPKGDPGTPGAAGAPGEPGAAGAPGAAGEDGISPTVATLPFGDDNCWNGGVSVTDAANNVTYVCNGEPGNEGPHGDRGEDGTPGQDGLSAFDIAVIFGGFVGSEQDWLVSLQGLPGVDGKDGLNGLPGADGAPGAPGVPGADGAPGASAYEVAKANGYTGTEVDWLASLKGDKGDPGIQGEQGIQGPAGAGNLATLNGTSCTRGGSEMTLSVTVDPTTGAVTLLCGPVITLVAVNGATARGYVVTEAGKQMTGPFFEQHLDSALTWHATPVPYGLHIVAALAVDTGVTIDCGAGGTLASGSCDYPSMTTSPTITLTGPGPRTVTLQHNGGLDRSWVTDATTYLTWANGGHPPSEWPWTMNPETGLSNQFGNGEHVVALVFDTEQFTLACGSVSPNQPTYNATNGDLGPGYVGSCGWNPIAADETVTVTFGSTQ